MTSSTSPTRPKSTSSSLTLCTPFLWANIRLESFPDKLIALPQFLISSDTISVDILPTNTISIISMVSSSVTLNPLTNLDSLPNLSIDLEISGPPPCTMSGFIPIYLRKTVSRAVEAFASSSTIACPPYLIKIFFS